MVRVVINNSKLNIPPICFINMLRLFDLSKGRIRAAVQGAGAADGLHDIWKRNAATVQGGSVALLFFGTPEQADLAMLVIVCM